MEKLARLLAPWVLRHLPLSWALRLLREGLRRLDCVGELDEMQRELFVTLLNDLDKHARRVGVGIVADNTASTSDTVPAGGGGPAGTHGDHGSP